MRVGVFAKTLLPTTHASLTIRKREPVESVTTRGARIRQRAHSRADRIGMTDLTELADDEHVTVLLDAYRTNSPKRTDESRGWMPRIEVVADWDADKIATAHGMAIAADLLEIQIEDATSGLRYRPRKAA